MRENQIKTIAYVIKIYKSSSIYIEILLFWSKSFYVCPAAVNAALWCYPPHRNMAHFLCLITWLSQDQSPYQSSVSCHRHSSIGSMDNQLQVSFLWNRQYHYYLLVICSNYCRSCIVVSAVQGLQPHPTVAWVLSIDVLQFKSIRVVAYRSNTFSPNVQILSLPDCVK
jgi:hypothetical protein